ncbi:hypothetical protein QYE76_064331 [Lolium multiflorum]|uniref:Uncharacterized protein n=1 Tax=Lolium multiflorum TaxID=4521 RepID=A0AAD8S804_LOLMU|nr:hypothetical protein QYE76_064331 [Lolium multiflorum]
MPKQHQGRARHGVDMAMPAMSHLDAPPLPSLHDRPHHRVQRVAKDPRRSPISTIDREDADKPRTTRAQVRPGTPRTAWATSLAHGHARHGHAAFAVPRPSPLALVLDAPRGARRTRSRHPLAPTVAGEDERARHGRASTSKRPTTASGLKKDVTITRLRAQIASLEATVKAQEEQLMEIEEDEAGADLRGGDAFLSDDDDFEEDEFTEEEDYAFLEPGPDDVVPIDIEDEGSHT